MGAIVAATGGEASYDRAPGLRPEDLKALHKAARHSPGVHAVGEIVSDPTGVLTLGKSIVDLAKKPGVGSGIGAGVAAAGLLPIGRLGKAKKALEAAEETKPATSTAVKDLRGALAGKTPKMGKYEKVGAKLDDPNLGKSAGQLRNEQNKLYAAERKKRIAEHERIFNEAIAGGMNPEEAHHLAGKALAGVLPKLEFTAGKELNRENIGELFARIQEHPDLRAWERRRTRTALLKVFDGVTLQHNEIKLLKKTFGESDTKKLVGSVGLMKQLKGTAAELINVPRAVMSTLDMSALLRQNLVATITHPVITARNVKPMLKAFKSEHAYDDVMDYIVNHPLYDKAIKGDLAITDFENGLAHREEAYYGANLAERLTGGEKFSPIRMSGRAYVALLNKTRMDIFSHLLGDAERLGLDTNDQKVLKDLAKAVNSATGRGAGPEFMRSALPVLNTLFFSPRLLFSRLDYLNPVNYTKLNPVARREYLKGALALTSTVGTVLMLAKLSGAKVGVDPTNADFAKIRLGNTRIDLLGGFQQPIRLLAQLQQGKVTSSTTGKTLTLGPQGPGNLSRWDIAERFFQGKLAPVPGMAVDVLKGRDFQGNPLSLKNEAYSHLSPLAIQDAIDLLHESGPEAALGGYGLTALGVGVQTYGPRKPKTGYQKGQKQVEKALKAGQITQAQGDQILQDLAQAYGQRQGGASTEGTWGH